MESKPAVLSDPNLLAEFVRESQFKGFFEKRFASPPDLAALLFRDGALIDAYKGTQFSMGGLWEKVKGVIGGSHHYALMLADLKPFQVQFPVQGMSRDNVEISGVATLELQLSPDKSGNILGLMSGVARNEGDAKSGDTSTTGRKALSRFDVLARIEPQFQDRVFEHAIGRHDADDIRGNRGLQDQLQADMMTEAERICGNVGVMVNSSSVTWAMNEKEREDFARAQIARQQEALEYQLKLMKREVERQSEATQVKISASVDEAKLKQSSEDELAHMVLNSEVAFIDAREGAARRQEMDALLHEIEILRTERAGKFENELAGYGQQVDITKEQGRLAEVQNDIDKLNRAHQREMQLLDAEHGSDIADIGRGTQSKDFDEKNRQTQEHAKTAAENLDRINRVDGDRQDRDSNRTIKEEDAGSDRKIRETQSDAESRVAQMKAAAGMSAEQISAVTASYSQGAADVEIAKAKAAGDQKTVELIREIQAEERQHGHKMFETGMKGGTGMAAGVGGTGTNPLGGESANPDAKVDCPKCGKSLPAKANFCNGCGHQMRT